MSEVEIEKVKGEVWVKLEIYEDERYKVERPSIGAYSLQYFVDRITKLEAEIEIVKRNKWKL